MHASSSITANRTTTAAAVALIGTATVMAPLAPEVSNRIANMHTPAIGLTAGGDLLGGWSDLFNTAETNATDIFNHFSTAPFPAIQQVFANQIGFVQSAFTDPSSIGNIPGEIENNLTAAGNAFVNPFTPDPSLGLYGSLDTSPMTITAQSGLLNDPSLASIVDLLEQAGILNSDGSLTLATLPGHEGMLTALTSGVPLGDDLSNALNTSILGLPSLADSINDSMPGLINVTPDGDSFNLINILIPDEGLRNTIEPLLAFSGSPLSGVLWGMFGTSLSPFMQFSTDFTSFTTDLTNQDWSAAFQDVFNAPENVLNAFLNGYGDVDLSSVLNGFGITLPTTLGSFDPNIELGGLLSGGGSLFDAIGVDATLGDCSVLCAALDLPSTGVGPLASMVELAQAVAVDLGWSGVGDPLADVFSGLF